MANNGLGGGEPPAGDHLQSVYRFWLVGHQLEHGAAPWKDPYSFQPLVEPQTVVGGWPFGFVFWPLDTLFGPIVAWNLLLLATVVAAGLLTYGWLRSLGLGRPAAVIGGLAFAIAPYRLEQSAGHLLGWIAVFLPLALLAIERSRAAATPGRAHGWGGLGAAAIASIALSGQLHLALGAVPLLLGYAAIRFRPVPFGWTAAGALAATGVGLAVRYTLIAGSPEGSGRSLDEVHKFQADWLDLLNRWHRPSSEEFVYLGWLTPVLALVGLVVLARRQRGLALLLGIGVLVPVLLALGTNLPTYAPLWHAFPPLRYPRVPERFLPIANLALAALVAVAAAELVRRSSLRATALAAALFVLVALDLGAQPLSGAAADPGNRVYQKLADLPPGRVIDVPLFAPGVHLASVYDYYELQSRRERPGGYSTIAPQAAFAFYFTHDRLSCGVWMPGDAERLGRLGVRYVVFHAGMYRQARLPDGWFAWRGLVQAGYRPVATDGALTLFGRGSGSAAPAPVAEPAHDRPVLCQGWEERRMIQREAPVWLFGGGVVELHVGSDERVSLGLLVDGRLVEARGVAGNATLTARLAGERWHVLLFRASKPGLRLYYVRR
jgi:hypothetical protein